jgi:hypothetical protein
MAAVCALMALAFFATATPATAQEPHYLKALSDLRTARDYLQYDKGARFGSERHHAVDEINKAIDEIKRAAWDDGKNTKFTPPSGAGETWVPIHVASRSLELATNDVEQGGDLPANTGLRDRALFHIKEAHSTLVKLMQAGAQ